MPNSTVGVDISKTHLDVYVVPAGQTARFPNDAAGFKALIARIDLGTDRPLDQRADLLEHGPRVAAGRGQQRGIRRDTIHDSQRHEAGNVADIPRIDEQLHRRAPSFAALSRIGYCGDSVTRFDNSLTFGGVAASTATTAYV